MVAAITTGVFQVPAFNSSRQPNDRINIIFKNPSDRPLTVNLMLEFSKASYAPSPESVGTLPPITVPAHSTLARSVRGTLSQYFLRLTFWGDIMLDEMPNKLSVEVLAGTSTGNETSAELIYGEATTLFRHENFVDTVVVPSASTSITSASNEIILPSK